MNALDESVSGDKDQTTRLSPECCRIVADGQYEPTIFCVPSNPLDLTDHLCFRRETGAHQDLPAFLEEGGRVGFRLKAMLRTCFTPSTGIICIDARTLLGISSRSLRFR